MTRSHEARSYSWMYTCITGWFIITAPIMILDALYCLLRPRSMIGGDLHWPFKIYEIYQEVDLVYGVKAFEGGEGFASAAAILNLLEISANLVYLWTTHVYPHPSAALLGYSGALMTLAKTILYVGQEYFCNWCATGHNSFLTALMFWYMPNIVWIVMSSLTIYRLGSDILISLTAVPRAPSLLNGETQSKKIR